MRVILIIANLFTGKSLYNHTVEGRRRKIFAFLNSGSVAALLVLTILLSPVHAQQTLTWDSNGATAGTGGTGTWNTSSPIWLNGTTFQAWNNSTFNNALFGGGSGVVTLSLPINVHHLNFTATTYTLTGNTLTLGGLSPTITTNHGVTATISTTLSGSNGLVKSGAGSLILAADNSGFTGVTTVAAGTLQINNANALGSSIAASDLVLNNGSAFTFNVDTAHNYTLMGNSVSVGGAAVTWSGSPTLTASTTLILSGTLGTLSGNLADTGSNVLSVVRNGFNRMTLTGNNTYTGSTTIIKSFLTLASTNALSAGSNLIFNGAVGTGGSLEMTSAYGNFSRGLGIGAGQVQWTGDGGFLSSSNSARIVNIGGAGGRLVWGSGGFVPTGNRLILGTVSNSTLDFQNSIDLSGGIRAIQPYAGNLSGHARVNGVLSGTGGLNVVSPSPGMLELRAANTYTGGTVLTSGILVVGSDSNLGASSGTLTFNGGTLENTAAFTTARSITLNAGGGVFQTDANLGASGLIGGVGGLTKAGTGSLTLTNANTYTGGTTISAGTLQIGNGGTTGSIVGNIINNGSIVFNRSDNLGYGGVVSGTGGLDQRGLGTLTLTNTNTYTGGTTISAGTLQIGNGGTSGSIGGDITDNGLLVFNRSDGAVFGGTVSGTGGLEQRGSGTLTLTGANTYTGGTTISAGTLQIGNGGTSGSIGGNITDNGLLAFNRSDSAVFGGTVSGVGSLEQRGSGTLTLTGANTYTGGTAISAGTLQIGNGGTSGSIGGNITDNGLLAFNRSDATAFGGVISGAGSLEQRGAGTLVLTGSNTYTGGTTISAGTLAVGADNHLGDASGTLTFNGGTLENTAAFTTGRGVTLNAGGGTFQTDANLGVSGLIGGVGGLLKTGSESLTLTNTNSYAGGTTISAGTLQIGNGGTTGSIAGDVADNGLLAFNRSDAAVFEGTVSGTGSLEQRGTGTLTLTGANTYRGGTVLTAGTLAVGSDDALGEVSGSLTFNGGTLENTAAFTTARSITLNAGGGVFQTDANLGASGLIGGVGGLTKAGTGSLTLTNANTYTGGTTISAGTLQIGDGGTTGSIVGNIFNNGSIVFNRSDNLSYGGAISGIGAFKKENTGTLVLTGNSSGFQGTTIVSAGTLEVNGSLGASLLINSGARLQGTGSVGTTVMAGTMAPGNSIGTLHVNGNYTQLVGSGYDLEINASEGSDRIAITGQAHILGGAVVVKPMEGSYVLGTRYTILTADGGRTGQFDTLSQSLPFINLALTYDSNNIYLDLLGRNSFSFCDVAVTRNQCAAGQAVDRLGSGNPIYNAIVGLPTKEAAQHAFNSLSGEIHASVKSVMIEDSRFVREAVSDRVREAFGSVGSGPSLVTGQTMEGAPGSGRTFWTRTFGSFGHRNADGNAAQINRNIGGIFFGGDIVIADKFLLGLASGYSNSSFNVNDRDSTSSSDNYHLSGYGGTQWGALGLRVGAAQAWHILQTNRSIAFSGFSDHTKGNYTGGTTQVFGELGYALPLTGLSIEPFVRAAYVNFNAKGFSESGDAASLNSSNNSEGVTYTTVGLNTAKTFSSPGGVITTVRGMLGWRHALGNLTSLSTFSFDGGSPFVISGLPIVGDAMVLSGGLDTRITKAATLGIYYSGQVLNNILDNGVRANFSWRF